MRNLTRALFVAALLGSIAMAGCASTAGQPSAGAAQPSAGAAQQSAGAGQQSAGEVVDDGVVTAKVKAKLIDDPVTKAYQINVETFKGTVQLSGSVDSEEARSRATELAKNVGGVKDVKNSLQVRKSDG
jgi:osmotically-inducible protein OsmY